MVNRFKANFEALDEKKWAELEEKVRNIPAEVFQDNETSKAELERLITTIETINGSIGSIQPFAEFVNPNIQNHLKSFDNHLNNLKNSQANQKANHLNYLNDTATQIIEIVWPFLSTSDAADAAGKAFTRYRALIESEEKNIGKARSEADEAMERIEQIEAKFSEYQIELLEGTDQQTSIKEDIAKKTSVINQMFETTNKFYLQLTQGDAETASIKNVIEEAQNSAVEDSSKITKKLTESEQQLEELHRIHTKVFGLKEDGEVKQKGLETQLDERGQQLEKMVRDFDVKFTSLVKKVEDLLPGATSAGLASAYSDLRVLAKKREFRYSVAFFALLFVLTIAAAATITQSISIWPPTWERLTFPSPLDYITKLIFNLPIIVPILWAALTVSKRRSEMHRLAEEYAHKEALAKSYEGFKKQIIELEENDKGLLAELLATMLKAVSLNAAQTLEGKHGEKLPVQEVFEEMTKRLSFIEEFVKKQNNP